MAKKKINKQHRCFSVVEECGPDAQDSAAFRTPVKNTSLLTSCRTPLSPVNGIRAPREIPVVKKTTPTKRALTFSPLKPASIKCIETPPKSPPAVEGITHNSDVSPSKKTKIVAGAEDVKETPSTLSLQTPVRHSPRLLVTPKPREKDTALVAASTNVGESSSGSPQGSVFVSLY